MIINKGIDVNILDFDGNTPLHYACINNVYTVAQLLIESNRCVHQETTGAQWP
jgi:ankyrin repeat protein